MSNYRHCWSAETNACLDDHTLNIYRLRDAHYGPTMFMIHGLEEEWHVWHKVCLNLQNKARPYCLELPWSGRNGQQWGRLRHASAWLHETLSLASARPSVLVGHSLGANAILEYLLNHDVPGLQAVVLVSPFYRASDKAFNWTLFDHSKEIFRAIMLESLCVRQGKREIDPSLLVDMADKIYEMIGPRGYMEFLSLFMRTPSLQLERIRTPVLVIGGSNDIGSTPESNKDLAHALPYGHLEIIADSGHFCMLTHPQIVAQLLDQFLQCHLTLSPNLRGNVMNRIHQQG